MVHWTREHTHRTECPNCNTEIDITLGMNVSKRFGGLAMEAKAYIENIEVAKE